MMPFLVLKQNICITRALECGLHQSGKIDESPWERTSSAWKSSALLLILNHFLTNVFGQESLNKKNRVSNANPRNQMQMNLKRACISQTLLFFEFSSLIVGAKLTTSCSFLYSETKPLNYCHTIYSFFQSTLLLSEVTLTHQNGDCESQNTSLYTRTGQP